MSTKRAISNIQHELECNLPHLFAAPVLLGDNVFDLMRCRTMLLSKPAVLATITGRAQDKEPGSSIQR